jgi:RNA polymerase sigma factor (sigma-70 family)
MATTTASRPPDSRNILRKPDDEKTVELRQLLESGNEFEVETALGALYNYLHDAGVRLAAAITGDTEAAQEIYDVAFGRTIARGRKCEQFAIYMRRVIANLCNEYFRKSGANVVLVSESAPEGSRAYETAAYEPDTDNEIIVRELLSKLALGDREILRRYYELGMTIDEMTVDLGVSRAVVHKRLERARQRVRDLLGE